MSHYSPNIDAARLAQLTEEVNRVARSLSQLTMSADADVRSEPNDVGCEISPETVQWLISARRGRSQFLPDNLFAEPSWDILLDLMRAELLKQRISVSSLCIAAAVPATTALRHINTLVKQGIIVRRSDPFDGRRSYLELSRDTSEALRAYFAKLIDGESRKRTSVEQ